jgi:hypothetical protein
MSGESTTIPGILYLFFAFYVLGIVLWFFPYLLLSLILLALSLFTRAQVMIQGFALSPIAMTVFTMVLMYILPWSYSGNDQNSSSLLWRDQDFIRFNLVVLAFSLIWGYVCVGIGFGIYKLLQHLQIIRDEAIGVAPGPTYQYE